MISQATFNVSQAIAKTFDLDTTILDEEILNAVKKASGLSVAPIYTEDNFKIFYVCTRSITSAMVNNLQCRDTSIVLGDKVGEVYDFSYSKPVYLDAYIIIAANDKIMGSFAVGRAEVSGYKINSIDYNKSEISDYSRREQLLALNKDLTIEFDSATAEHIFSIGTEAYKSQPKVGRKFYGEGVQYQPHLLLQPEGFTICVANDSYSKIFVEISLYSNNPVYIIEVDGGSAIITTNSEKVKKRISRMRETLANHNTYQFGYIIKNITYKRRIRHE